MSNLINHAKREFRAAGWTDDDGVFKDEMQGKICEHILKLLELFSDEGHSGNSASYALGVFDRLAKFEPIAPLTGEDSEWVPVADGLYQNNRCGHVFKENGKAYDIEGRIFWEWVAGEDGVKTKCFFQSKDSEVPVEFPYTPGESELVFRPTTDFPQE